jgi:hypothetical protein
VSLEQVEKQRQMGEEQQNEEPYKPREQPCCKPTKEDERDEQVSWAL